MPTTHNPRWILDPNQSPTSEEAFDAIEELAMWNSDINSTSEQTYQDNDDEGTYLKGLLRMVVQERDHSMAIIKAMKPEYERLRRMFESLKEGAAEVEAAGEKR